MDLGTELERIYDSEISVRIKWLWDGGIEVRLGDEVNGFVAEETFAAVAGILPWLQQAISYFYPDSPYAQTLDDGVKARAIERLFHPPSTAARVRCPYCGEPRTAPPGMEQVFQFVCEHCGASVNLEPSTIH